MTIEPPPVLIASRTHISRTGFRGVTMRANLKFRAAIRVGRKLQWLGDFPTAQDAALAYDDAARRLIGSDAFLNFAGPDEQQTVPSKRDDDHCSVGHVLLNGSKYCRVCNREAEARYKARRKAKAKR